MPRYDIDQIKRLAAGRWAEIFAHLAGMRVSVFSKHHKPCPKCGGRDRFRMIDESRGALICNQCFRDNNSDGLQGVQWLLDCDFPTAVEQVAKHLGLQPIKQAHRKAERELDFVEWNDQLARMWCHKKSGITLEALKACGAKIAVYRKRYRVIAIPIYPPAQKKNQPNRYALYCIRGGTIPRFENGKPVEQLKMKLTQGSNKGARWC